MTNETKATPRRIRRRKLSTEQVDTLEAANVDFDDVRTRIDRMTEQLNGAFVNRDVEVRLLILAMLTRLHFLFISDAGAGKTALIDALASHFSARYFVTTLNAYTTVDEVFGPTDVVAYTKGVRRRIFDGHLCASHIGLVDEPFKGSTAIRNSFLEVMERRSFGGKSVDLWSMGGGTNWPEIERMDEGLAAFYDRFMLRAIVAEVSDEPDSDGDSDFDRMLKAGEAMERSRAKSGKRYLANADAMISIDELAAVHEQIEEAVTVPDSVYRLLTSLRRQMREQKCVLSPRRCVLALTVLKASAWLDGRDVVTADDFDALTFVAWKARPDFAKAKAIIAAIDLKAFQKIAQSIDAVRAKVRAEAQRTPDLKRTRAVMGQVAKCAQDVVAQMNDCPLRKHSVEQLTSAVDAMKKEAEPVSKGLRDLIQSIRAQGGSAAG